MMSDGCMYAKKYKEARSNRSCALGGFATGALLAEEKVGLGHHGSLVFVFTFEAFNCYFDFLTCLGEYVSRRIQALVSGKCTFGSRLSAIVKWRTASPFSFKLLYSLPSKK